MVAKLPPRNSLEWENLCDRCAKCCVFPGTEVACRYLDIDGRRCLAYEFRHEVPYCMDVSQLSNRAIQEKMPDTCAYSRALDGKVPLVPGELIATTARILPEVEDQIVALNDAIKEIPWN